MKDYTVIGYWSDQNQPWLEFTRGPDPMTALTTLVNRMAADPDYEGTLGILMILEVVEGRHQGLLGLDEGVPASEYVRKGPKEWRPKRGRR